MAFRMPNYTDIDIQGLVPPKIIGIPPTPPESLYNRSESPDIVSAHGGEDDIIASEAEFAFNLPFPLPPRTNHSTEVLQEDRNTPDHHVSRDPRLIRLTGVHPFNVEAPLSDLYDEGFITSTDLFYVRNHGAVPEVDDSAILNWEISIDGLVENPMIMTLKDLIRDYEQVTNPVTFVCAGNRRKEQNQVRKSKGFSWGPAGVSTALWTGVLLSELIKRARPKRGARYVCMEGSDKLPNGFYGTCVKLNWALDPNRCIMLAYKMNGEILRPDHGKPLRVVVPGQIGGRSVKWLRKLTITERPSENWYHVYDNKVLPTMISPVQSAKEPKWWSDERYAIYDLSTNSVTVYPAHHESVLFVNGPQIYSVKGFAYSGGGRRITRVEITLNKGKSWMLAHINYPEDAYREYEGRNLRIFGGKLDMSWRETSFCWCFWSLDIPVEQLVDSNDIMVRATDESMNTQPRDMYWNVLGMMNNPWYRITINKEDDYLRFEHPTQPALIPGGWMDHVKKSGGDLTNGFWGEHIIGHGMPDVTVEPAEVKMVKDGINHVISIDELREHETDTKPWFVLKGEVYDGAKFLGEHPGGAASIIGAAGQDVTDEFMAIHSETAKAMMHKYHVGSLDKASLAMLNTRDTNIKPDTCRPVFLESKVWTKAPIVEKKKISSDVRIFSFQLEHEGQQIGLPVGQHLMMRLYDPVTNAPVIRSYTPISDGKKCGRLDILIKIYFDTPEQKGGVMTQALEAAPIGHSVEFKGPIGKFQYLGMGNCSINGRKRYVRRFIMICGGSGITPIFQVLRAVLENDKDPTKCLLLDGNRAEEDILCRKKLESLAEGKSEQCRLIFTLTKPTESWGGLRGRVGRELLKQEVGSCEERQSGGDELVLICGPGAMEKSVHSALNDLGWKNEDLLFF